MSSAKRLLDGVYSLSQLDALEPAAVVDALAGELTDAAAIDTHVPVTVTALDALCARAMKQSLERDLAMDSSIGQPTRNVFASTVVSYAGRLSLLGDRARDVAARGGAGDPGAVAGSVVEAAERVLALRDAVIAAVLALVAERARSLVDETDTRARDRRLPESERKAASALRRELEAMAADPARVTRPLAQRLATWPEQIDEPDPASEPTWADMIELD